MNLRHRTFIRSIGLMLLAAGIALGSSQNPLHAQQFGGGDSPTLEAHLTPAEGGIVRLELHLSLPAGSATYSQDPSFSKPTEFELDETNGLIPLEDKYTPDHAPKSGYDELFSQDVEKFTGEVTWTRRFRLQSGATADSVSIRGTMNHLVCDADSCVPRSHNFVATLAPDAVISSDGATLADSLFTGTEATAEPEAVEYELEVTPTVGGEPMPADVRFQIEPTDARPGESTTLSITVTLHDDWHTYGLVEGPDQVEKPTEIKIDQPHNLRQIGEFTPDHPAELYDNKSWAFHDQVTWSSEFEVIEEGPYGISGSIRFQICKSLCMAPKRVEFSLGVAGETDPLNPVVDVDGSSTAATGPSTMIGSFQLAEDSAIPSGLWMNLAFAFLGGLILNVMPCVLPVIAVKVLSFVQQAGESRERILALNATYSLGVVFVFTVLACLAVFLGYGWGELFQMDEFNLVMAAFVFAMGLSLLGVFELPVPGMIGSAAGGQHKEGLPGAFMTGIFATLLATPCSGPFMGTTLAWSVKQPTQVTFLIWIVMGIGMASPYLVIGAFPNLVKWLPKPGMWMVRFKEFAGFVLMGAVIWIINAINQDMLIPTLIILVGVALGVWMVGNLYDHSASREKKWSIRGLALVMSCVICGYGWSLQYRGHELPWEEFSTARIEELREEGTPVLIDFTADWCAICKTNELRALNRQQTIEFVEEHGVVTMMADYTDESPEIRRWLELCNQEGVPLTLIFAKDRPDVAIPLRGPYSQAKLLETLEAAIDGDLDLSQTTATQTADASSTGTSPAGAIR